MNSPLDDRDTATHAWARFRKILRWMALAALVTILIAFAVLYATEGFVSIHLYIATALGIGLTMMLGAALMGLVFLSNGTGHDASVARTPEERKRR
jgi:small-conductance mechanosensitive channel